MEHPGCAQYCICWAHRVTRTHAAGTYRGHWLTIGGMANSTKRGLLGLTAAQGVTMFWVGVGLMIVAFLMSLWKSL